MTITTEAPGTPATDLPESPYVGLVPFSESEARFFFGRERERTLVTANLKGARLTLLYGPSGVGKSSLLLAGVVHALREAVRQNSDRGGTERAPMAVAVVRSWRDDPVAAIGTALHEAVTEALGGRPAESWTPGEPLVDAARRWAPQVRTLLLVLDQFEELFLYHGAEGGEGTLASELPKLVNERGLRLNVLISIREDALARLDRFKGRIPGLFGNYLRVEALDRAAAREAITRPLEEWARRGGEPLKAEPALVDAVLAGVESGKVVVGGAGGGVVALHGDRGAAELRIEAPYLQLVLSRLWDVERAAGSGLLRLSTLESLGGADRIVRTHLDEALGSLSPREQEVAARLFYHLVTPSGTKIAHRLADLAGYASVPEETAAAVVDQLAGPMRVLRPVDDSSYEIFHDVLAPAVLEWRARAQERLRAARRMRRRMIFLLAGLALGGLGAVAQAGHLLRPVELSTVDLRFAVRGTRPPPRDVAVVAVDDRTFSSLGVRWPFPRRYHASVIRDLRRDGARVIAFDAQFTEPTDVANDNALIQAVADARNVVLATSEVGPHGTTSIFGGLPLGSIHARAGWAIAVPDSDGVVRRMVYAGDGLKSFAIGAAEQALGHPIPRRAGSQWIDFVGPPGSIRTYSYADVYRGKVPSAALRGRVVVVGAASAQLQDIHATPTSGGVPMSGAELQANMIETALHGFPLGEVPAAVAALLVVLLALVAPLASIRLRPILALAAAALAGAAYVATLQLTFDHGAILPAVIPLGVLALTALAALALDAGA